MSKIMYLFILLILSAAFCGAAYSQEYTIINLETFGGNCGVATGINQQGQLVGFAETENRPFACFPLAKWGDSYICT